jgi:hypothetical protein
MKKTQIFNLVLGSMFVLAMGSCQKMSRPELGDYPKDANPPTGPLKFFVSFNGTSTDAKTGAVDSIQFTKPVSNTMDFATGGVNGTRGVTGNGTQYIQYGKPNNFCNWAESFTVSFWEKRNGMPVGEAEFPFSISSSNGHWAGTSMMLLFDHAGSGATNSLAVIKLVLVDRSMNDTWLAWEGGNKVPNIQDNAWHHLVFVYDAATSKVTLYVDGVANTNTPQWGSHGKVMLDYEKVKSFQIGGRPKEDLGWGRSWTGSLDQFRMYSSALTASEVAALYSSKQ